MEQEHVEDYFEYSEQDGINLLGLQLLQSRQATQRIILHELIQQLDDVGRGRQPVPLALLHHTHPIPFQDPL